MEHRQGQALEDIGIDRLVAGGEGLGRLSDGRVVFVPGVVPGDHVRVALTQSKRDLARGVVTELLSPGPERVEPPCSRVAAGCGGCDWQQLSISAQHAAKVSVVADAFSRIARLPQLTAHLRFGGAVGADTSDGSGWRTTVRAGANRSGRAGFYRAGSHDVVASGACLVAHPVIADVLDSATFAPGEEVVIRVGVSGRQLVVGSSSPDAVKLRSVPAGWSAEVVRMPAGGGVGAVQESINGVDLRVSISSFFQSGPQAASLLASTVTDLFQPFGTPDVFVDLYGGVGLFAATAGRGAREVVVVESAASSVSDARHNLGPDALVHRSPVEEWEPPRIVRRASNLHAVADPARAGLGRDGVAAVLRCKPAVFVLVSCDAASGARDARMLTDSGYQLREAVVLDLFPHTSHVETVMQFVATGATEGSE